MLYAWRVAILIVIIFVLVTLFFVYFSMSYAATDGCPANTIRKANYLDVRALEGKIAIGACIDSVTEAVIKPQQSGAAKEFLYSIRCSDSAGGTSARVSIDKLNPEFAICAANFLETMKNSSVSDVCLRDGYRTPEQQARPSRGIKCKPTRSDGYPCPHPQGVAIDVNTSLKARGYKILHDAAPSFGLVFNVSGPSGGDPYHFEPIAHRRSKRQNSLTGKAIRIADGLGIPQGACLTGGYSPPGTIDPRIAQPRTRPPTNPLTDYFRKRQTNAQCEELAAECKRTLSQTCLAQYSKQCQGDSAQPTPSGGGQPSGQPQPSKQTSQKTVSKPTTKPTDAKTSSATSTKPKVVTATLEPAHAISAESIFGKEENPFAKKPSTTTQEIIDRLTKISQGSFQSGATTSTTTRIHSIEVPLPDLVDVATVFEQRQNIEIKNIDYLSDNVVSIEVQLREPDGSTGVSGFFSVPEETFVSKAYNEGPIDRLCKERPWSGLRITSAIVSPVFDSVCLAVGAKLGGDDFVEGYGE